MLMKLFYLRAGVLGKF